MFLFFFLFLHCFSFLLRLEQILGHELGSPPASTGQTAGEVDGVKKEKEVVEKEKEEGDASTAASTTPAPTPTPSTPSPFPAPAPKPPTVVEPPVSNPDPPPGKYLGN